MSIHFISGKPGGGKTLYSVRLIVDELVHGNRLIVTNVALKLPSLNKYLQEKYPYQFERLFCNPDHPRHISERIHLISEDELAKFFTFRDHFVQLESYSNAEWKAGKRPNYDRIRDGGVLYVLDEIHIAFNSRAWADTGAEVLYYLSQHRKIGDDVVCITQSINNVDKQFRSVAQDYTYIKNLAKQRAGLFRLPGLFIRNTYAQPATETSKPMESGTFQLDVSGLADCYDTAKGVGIHGRSGADTRERKKGLHWLWFAVGFPLLLWALFHFGPRLIVKGTNPKIQVVMLAKPVEPPKIVVPPAPVSCVVTQYVEVKPSAVPPDASPTNELYSTGYVKVGRDYVVFLSDGTSVATESGRIQTIDHSFVVVDGVKLKIKRAMVVSPPKADAPLPAVQTADVSPSAIEQPEYRPPFGGVVVTPAVGGSHARQ